MKAYIQPVIVYPADIPRSLAYEMTVNESFLRLANWFQRIIGKPFNRMPAAWYQKYVTTEEWIAQFPNDPVALWVDAITRAGELRRIAGKCNPKRLYVFVSPAEVKAGGMIGCESWKCKHILPGQIAMTGWAGQLLGGVESADWTSWPGAMGALAHEIGHAVCLLPHPGDLSEELKARALAELGPDWFWHTVEGNWWSWQENQPESAVAPGFLSFEKEALLASPVFT
jgi:hypothetical protein